MHGRILTTFALLLSLAGCTDISLPGHKQHADPTTLAQSHDVKKTGTIRGQVVWDGDVPSATKKLVRANAYNPRQYQNAPWVTTPHVPKVNTQTNGVANAVVFLRAVDAQRSKPWDLPKLRVVFRNRELLIEQGDTVSQIGFVQRGHAVEIANRDNDYQVLRGRGDAFFSMPLMQAGKTHERVLDKRGLVDLTSAAGYYWMHAHVFVVEHPYYTRTDAEGRFILDRVPPGPYELICWLPDWNVLREERDPETATVARLAWAAPQEQTQTVTLAAGQQTEVRYHWKVGMFGQR